MRVDSDGREISLSSAGLSFREGRITFDPGSDFDFLAEGESATVVISYQVSDDAGEPLSDQGSLTIHITGANDQPVAVADSGSGSENSTVEVDVLANDSDPNAGDLLRVSAASVLSATVAADGSQIALGTSSLTFAGSRVSFDPGTDFDFLATGEVATVVIGLHGDR